MKIAPVCCHLYSLKEIRQTIVVLGCSSVGFPDPKLVVINQGVPLGERGRVAEHDPVGEQGNPELAGTSRARSGLVAQERQLAPEAHREGGQGRVSGRLNGTSPQIKSRVTNGKKS